ncbi:MAG: TerB family tellurite resistance protein [Chryseolinea sp.]
MNESEKIFQGYSDSEKVAYLAAIASVATADRSATEEEVDFLRSLAKAADLPQGQDEEVINAAMGISGEELKKALDVLQNSKLRFSLITDIITFAKVDQRYTAEEKESIQKIAGYLKIDPAQFSLLDQFVDKATQSPVTSGEGQRPNILESLGLKNKFEGAGINTSGFGGGILAMLGPLVLQKIFGGRSGGMFGQGGNTMGSSGGFGGLGSIFSMLTKSGGRGGLGNILSKILK